MALRPPSPPVGLCESCAHVRMVENRRGSRFFLCMLAESDPRFDKYPRLPVLVCAGFRPAGAEAAPVAPAGPGSAEGEP